jgi:primosomal protein N' (replication factor Y)
VRRLQSQGLLVRDQRRKPPVVRQRWVPVVRLCLGREEAQTLMQQLQRRAPNQAAVLAYLLEQPDCELARLDSRLVGARAAVKRLEQRAAVSVAAIEKMRTVVPSTAPTVAVLPTLNQAQQHALQQIETKLLVPDGVPVLLHGVTGSGKTEVYMRAIATVLRQGKSALVLVPEISLTAQAVERFTSRFGAQIAVLHSGLSAGERFDEWRRLSQREARIAMSRGGAG